MRDDPEILKSVSNALALLQLVGEEGALGVSAAARRLGVGRSTAHRLLSTLERASFVEHEPSSGSYRVGTALAALGLGAARRLDIRQRARPHLESLMTELDETVNLIALQGRHVLFMDCVEGRRTLRIGERVGLRQPAHCNSVGKALLATLPPGELVSLFPDETLPAATQRSITARSELLAQLEDIRRRGYATNVEESEPDVFAVGAAIQPACGLPAGIGVSIPMSRVSATLVEEIGAAVCRTARTIADALEPDRRATVPS